MNDLLSATDLDKIKEALNSIFSHLNKKLKLSPYPIRRALPFVEAISEDFRQQMLKVIGNRQLMYLSFEEFEKASHGCESPSLVADIPRSSPPVRRPLWFGMRMSRNSPQSRVT